MVVSKSKIIRVEMARVPTTGFSVSFNLYAGEEERLQFYKLTGKKKEPIGLLSLFKSILPPVVVTGE
jgi:hypothetical protein